jgi:hypothetical protein
VSWSHIRREDREHARQRRTDVEDRVSTPSIVVAVRPQAADPAAAVVVLERRGDHPALADTSARRKRLQIDAARP